MCFPVIYVTSPHKYNKLVNFIKALIFIILSKSDSLKLLRGLNFWEMLQMDFKILNKTNEEVVFLLEGINHVIANSLRRAIMSDVCTLAIENVHVIKNSSAIYDEMIAHRLGLVPLKTDLKSYTQKEKCRCKGKGCAHCELILTLKKKGPCVVYASDLISKDKKITPVFPNMPITKLLKDQEINLESTAVLSFGGDHTKFSPGLVYYQGYPEIKIGSGKNLNKAAESCPVNILEVSGGRLKVKDIEKCILCKACSNESNAIEVEGSKSKFIFHVEPWGQLSAKEMLMEGIRFIDDKLDEFEGLVKKIK